MESLITSIWNIRGAVDYSHRVNLKHLNRELKANLICIQETKCQKWSKHMKESVWGFDNHGWLESSSRGLSGGLITTWDSSIIECVSSRRCRHFIPLNEKIIAINQEFSCFNNYALTNPSRILDLWNELSQEYWHCHMHPVILIGDFHCVRSADSRVNCRYADLDTKNFNGFIESLGLEEVAGELNYTWYGRSSKKSTLDRALVNHEWLRSGYWLWKFQRRRNSDHRPLSIFIQHLNWGPKPFRFFDWWLNDPRLKELI